LGWAAHSQGFQFGDVVLDCSAIAAGPPGDDQMVNIDANFTVADHL
jgi:hypothetical protein